MPERSLSPRLAVPTVLLFAAGYPIGAATVSVMSPFLIILLRFAASALILWVIIAIRRPRFPGWRTIRHAMVAGLGTQGVQFLGLYWALSHGVASGLASLIVALNPVVTAGIMALTLGHRESRRGVLALLLATTAVALACAPKIIADHSAGISIVAAIIGMLGLSAGSVYQGRHCKTMDPWLMTALGLTASLPFAGVFAAFTPAYTTDLPKAIILLIVMVVFNSVGATTLYAACVRQAGARAASILFAVIPAVASVLAWLALDETLSALTVGGLVLGAAACVLQARSRSDDAATPVATTAGPTTEPVRTAETPSRS